MPSVAIVGTRGYPSYYGGFETAVRHLAPYLVEAGWDVTVYGRSGATRPDDVDRDPRVGTRETRGMDTKAISTLSYGLTACVDVARRKPDVALVMNVANGFWLPLLRARRVPTLVNVDGIEWNRAKWGRFAKAVFHLGAKLTARNGTRLVYDSREIARLWKLEFGLDGEFIPYGGVAVDKELPVEEGLQSGQYVLVVARFVPENSIPEFIQAATSLGADHDVVIVGSSGYGGELDAAVRQLTETLPRVRWLGHISDDQRLYALWQHAGAYFHGHSVGGTNPALVQAMACGAPVVARDTPYNQEVLGDEGLFVAADSVRIEQTIRRVLTDSALRDDLRATSIGRAAGDYSWDSVCAKYESALRALAERQRPGLQGKRK